MELVQQVLVQIEASKLGDARALLDELDAHRRDLRGMRGFESMQISRSPEPGGNVLISVDSRWRDDASLTAYNAMGDSAQQIIERYSAVTVPGTLDVKRREVTDSGDQSGASVLYERLGVALMLPVGIFLVGFAVIYALSRVYLELDSKNGATALAVIVASGIFLVCAYFASNRVARWQYASAMVAVAALLLGGTVYAQVHEGPPVNRPNGGEVSGTPEPGGSPTAPGATVIDLNDNFFTVAGADDHNPTITAAAGAKVEIQNKGNALHNMHIEAAPGAGFEVAFCTASGAAPCSNPVRVPAKQGASITVPTAPGTYAYRCDFHTAEMKGEITVQ